ncbi:MAG: hypothetical protein GF317_00025 [Candidatus Lokiarchaeota archaeon]|nr:hypothetical protein [Candidatus Lokiarchaeota archaeon]MBD3198373.1 hypothetical protein [Candidatus Lokiarchaeota archaeon]
MNRFLEQIGLSEKSIEIYLKSLGKPAMTYYEINSLFPELEPKKFTEILEELMNNDLMFPLKASEGGRLQRYFFIPPIGPVLSYFSNIDSGFKQIETGIRDLIMKTVNDIFQNENEIELKTVYEQYKEIRKDIEEDSLLQKKDAEDISKEMEVIGNINKIIENLHTKLKGIIQTQFGSLIKTLSSLRGKLIDNIKSVGLKKNEDEVIQIIEDLFKAELNELVGEFNTRMDTLIEEEFNAIQTEPIIQRIIQSRNDFKMLLLNMISTYEMKFNSISDIIQKKRENLEPNFKELENKIISKTNRIIEDSINQVAGLNKPIIQLFQSYLENYLTPTKLARQNIWEISSIVRMNEGIINSIQNVKDELILIVPKLSKYLSLEMFAQVPENALIKVVASDPQVNSMVKKFKEIPNLNYGERDNKNFIALIRDNEFVSMGFIQEDSQDPINNLIGFACNYKPIASLLRTVFSKLWSAAKIDFGGPVKDSQRKNFSQKSEPQQPISSSKTSPKNQPISSDEVKNKTKTTIKTTEEKTAKPSVSKEISTELKASIDKKEKQEGEDERTEDKVEAIKDSEELKSEKIKEKSQSTEFASKIFPKPDDEAGQAINLAFNAIISNLGSLKGKEFSNELENVADIVLEKRGFSVTLHNLRSWINDYKKIGIKLTIQQQKEIFEKIEEWKKKLL